MPWCSSGPGERTSRPPPFPVVHDSARAASQWRFGGYESVYDSMSYNTLHLSAPARVVDKYNAKVFRVRFEKQEDVVRLQDRL